MNEYEQFFALVLLFFHVCACFGHLKASLSLYSSFYVFFFLPPFKFPCKMSVVKTCTCFSIWASLLSFTWTQTPSKPTIGYILCCWISWLVPRKRGKRGEKKKFVEGSEIALVGGIFCSPWYLLLISGLPWKHSKPNFSTRIFFFFLFFPSIHIKYWMIYINIYNNNKN